ncbi:hypothetical protein P7K49_028509 [Saguinus oedipus]|uniref:Uncharacterized protein n=1 Tax=Saguinus oedipus TaxID=9490 RepID=A0ABQ9U4J5_SAGOE|nr:hypothetical protein P7K49_028509 [Saguinus oedipus]
MSVLITSPSKDPATQAPGAQAGSLDITSLSNPPGDTRPPVSLPLSSGPSGQCVLQWQTLYSILIRRMAQSVVEVMEDSKGKAQEHLLANGGLKEKMKCLKSRLCIVCCVCAWCDARMSQGGGILVWL